MSGIAGILNFDREAIEPSTLNTMTNAMAYRGPDAISHWIQDGAALGHCMLRTTRESENEQQPYVHPETGWVITFAGRLDRRTVLLKTLASAGATCRKRFDAELVLAAYVAFGPKCLAHIEGDFAFAIWNPNRRQLFIARDRLGMVPIHFWRAANKFVFATDAHAILRLPFVQRRLNEGVVAEILSDRWQLGADTLWEGISTVRPGEYLLCDAGATQQVRYWPSRELLPSFPKNDGEYVDAYRALLSDSLANACRSSGPVTFSVSGGLDSSALICLAEKMRASNRLPNLVSLPCTLDYSAFSGDGELAFAEMACEMAGRPLAKITPVPATVEELERDCESFLTLPGYFNGRAHLGIIKYGQMHGSRVLVTGEGGDQLIGGQPSYEYELLRQKQWRRYGGALSHSALVDPRNRLLPSLSVVSSTLLPRRLDHVLRKTAKQLVRGKDLHTFAPWLSSNAHQILVDRAETRRDADSSLGDDFFWWPGRGEFFVNMLTLFERFGASHAMDVRHPYMAARLIELSAMMPTHLKTRNGVEKILHRDAMRGVLPEPIRTRLDKSGSERSVDMQVANMLTHFTPAARLPLRAAGYEALLEKFWQRDNVGLKSEGYDSWTLTSIWALSNLSKMAQL